MDYRRTGMRIGTTTYEVVGITNQTNQELINFCDPNNFGGNVRRHANGTATVEVYTD